MYFFLPEYLFGANAFSQLHILQQQATAALHMPNKVEANFLSFVRFHRLCILKHFPHFSICIEISFVVAELLYIHTYSYRVDPFPPATPM